LVDLKRVDELARAGASAYELIETPEGHLPDQRDAPRE
jgi:hypothetical protein